MSMWYIAWARKTSLQLKALGDSKLAVWQREDSSVSNRLACLFEGTCSMWKDLGSILAFDDFDGALEQDNKVRAEVRLQSMSV